MPRKQSPFKSFEELITHLFDGMPHWQLQAAMELGKLANKGDDRALEALIQALKRGKGWDIRANAARALGKVHNVRADEALREAERKDKDRDVQIAAANALSEKSDSSGVTAAIHRLEEAGDDVDEAISAIRALSKLGGARALDAILDSVRFICREPHPHLTEGIGVDDYLFYSVKPIFRGVVPAMVKIGEKSEVQVLIKSLEKLSKRLDYDSLEARLALVVALGKIKDAEAVEVLIAALKDKWPVNREAACALGEIGDTRAIKPLLQAWETPTLDTWDAAVKRVITQALKKIRPGEEIRRGASTGNYSCPCCARRAPTSMSLAKHMACSDQRHLAWIEANGLSLEQVLGTPGISLGVTGRKGSYKPLAEILEKKARIDIQI